MATYMRASETEAKHLNPPEWLDLSSLKHINKKTKLITKYRQIRA